MRKTERHVLEECSDEELLREIENRMKKAKRKITLADYTKEVKPKRTFSDYLKDFYSKHPIRTEDKKKRVIVSAGRVIF